MENTIINEVRESLKKDYNDCIAINSTLNRYIITGLNLTNKELKNKTNNY